MPPSQPNIDDPAPIHLPRPVQEHRDWLCLHCGTPIGRVELLSGTLIVASHGQTRVRLQQDDSGEVFCLVCRESRRWERCAWPGSQS